MINLQTPWKKPIGGLTFTANGRKLLAGGSGGIGVWNLPRPEPALTIDYHSVKELYAFELDPRDRWLFVSDVRRGCSYYSLRSCSWSRLPGDEHHVVSLSCSPDGSRLAISRGGGTMNRLECWRLGSSKFQPEWRVRFGQVETSFGPVYIEQDSGFFSAVTFSPDGSTLACVEEQSSNRSRKVSHVLSIRETASGDLVRELGKVPVPVGVRLTFSCDGTRLIRWEERSIEIWDIAAGGRIAQLAPPGRATFRSVAPHPGKDVFLTVANDGLVRNWNIESAKEVDRINWKVGKLHSVAFSADGTLAAVGSDTGKIVVWDVDL